jgi:hypothetical protein
MGGKVSSNKMIILILQTNVTMFLYVFSVVAWNDPAGRDVLYLVFTVFITKEKSNVMRIQKLFEHQSTATEGGREYQREVGVTSYLYFSF